MRSYLVGLKTEFWSEPSAVPLHCMCEQPRRWRFHKIVPPKFWSEQTSMPILSACEQWRFWRDCAFAKARLSIRRSYLRLVHHCRRREANLDEVSSGLARMISTQVAWTCSAHTVVMKDGPMWKSYAVWLQFNLRMHTWIGKGVEGCTSVFVDAIYVLLRDPVKGIQLPPVLFTLRELCKKRVGHDERNFWSREIIRVLVAQKNRLIETVILSTHNTCFVWEIIKCFIVIIFLLRSRNLRPGVLCITVRKYDCRCLISSMFPKYYFCTGQYQQIF